MIPENVRNFCGRSGRNSSGSSSGSSSGGSSGGSGGGPPTFGGEGRPSSGRLLTQTEVERAIRSLCEGNNVRVETLNQMRQIQAELGQLGVPRGSLRIIPQRPSE